MAFGLCLVLGAVTTHMVAERQEDPWALLLVRNLEIVMATGCLLVSAFRALGSRLAGPATIAVSWILAVWFPFGTAAFIWWMIRVRKREDPALWAKATVETSE